MLEIKYLYQIKVLVVITFDEGRLVNNELSLRVKNRSMLWKIRKTEFQFGRLFVVSTHWEPKLLQLHRASLLFAVQKG